MARGVPQRTLGQSREVHGSAGGLGRVMGRVPGSPTKKRSEESGARHELHFLQGNVLNYVFVLFFPECLRVANLFFWKANSVFMLSTLTQKQSKTLHCSPRVRATVSKFVFVHRKRIKHAFTFDTEGPHQRIEKQRRHDRCQTRTHLLHTHQPLPPHHTRSVIQRNKTQTDTNRQRDRQTDRQTDRRRTNSRKN